MGKTEKGALFLDPAMTSPYEFFQYWRNVQDADVERFLLMFTFLPIEECKRLAAGKDAEINAAKERLAWEVTAGIHGAAEADKALQAARAAFGGGAGDIDEIPSVSISSSRLEAGIGVLDLFLESKLASSKSDARRLIQQGGASVNGKKVADEGAFFSIKRFGRGALFRERGKSASAGYSRVTPPKASDSFETVNIFPDFWANSSSREPKQTSMPTAQS